MTGLHSRVGRGRLLERIGSSDRHWKPGLLYGSLQCGPLGSAGDSVLSGPEAPRWLHLAP